VLVKIRATTVSSADWMVRSLEVPRGFGVFARPAFGLFGPRKQILGSELSGEIEAVGSAVTRFAVGDEVFAFPGFDLGCHAEYRTLSEQGRIEHMPEGVSFEEAAAICFGGTTALHYLRDLAKIEPGNDVLIIGASGAVGSAAVQLAKHFGARVAAVTSTSNLERVEQLGADRVIDYRKEHWSGDQARYDVIFDTVGATGWSESEDSLKKGGRLLLCAATLPQLLGALRGPRKEGKRVLAGNSPETLRDMQELKSLAEAGRYRPLIDRCFPLHQIVEAHEYVATGRKRGSVVVTVGHSSSS
jgi:NADPH:quinone reductase-like Zn-dependent oxidoreductase